MKNCRTVHNIAKDFLANTYSRPNSLIFSYGKGTYLYDTGGNRYLDFMGGIAVNALGYGDKEISEIIYDQSKKLMHLSNLYHNEYSNYCGGLIIKSIYNGSGLGGKVFFTNSGTEANEAAIKFSRKYQYHCNGDNDKNGIVSFTNAFHGRSYGSLSLTPKLACQTAFKPLLPNIKYLQYNNADLHTNLCHINENTAAVFMEPIQGEGGINIASREFMRVVRKRCNEVDALLVLDEIQCGLGRTGKLWAHQHFPTDCLPVDLVTMAKPLGNGFPIGAVAISTKVADTIVVNDHGTTFGGNPLGCRIAINVIERISAPGFLANVAAVGTAMKSSLQQLQSLYPSLITDVRGIGLIIGLQFTVNPTPLIGLARKRGLLILTAANNTVRLIPPLILSMDDMKKGVDLLADTVAEFSRKPQ